MTNWKDRRDKGLKIATDAGSSLKKSTQKAARASGDSLNRWERQRVPEKLGSRTKDMLERVGQKLEQGGTTWEPRIQAALQAKSDKPAKFIAASIGRLGRGARKIAPLLGKTTSGAAGGLIGSGAGLLDTAITDKELEEMEVRCAEAAKRSETIAAEQNAIIQQAVDTRDKGPLLDTLAVGGITLAAAIQAPDAIPTEIEQAFALAYPRLAEEGTTFSGAIADKSGFIVGIGSHSVSKIGAERRRRYEALKVITDRLEGSNRQITARLSQSRRRAAGRIGGRT